MHRFLYCLILSGPVFLIAFLSSRWLSKRAFGIALGASWVSSLWIAYWLGGK